MVDKGHVSKEMMILVVMLATLSAFIGCRDAEMTSGTSCADSFFLPRWSSWLRFYRGDTGKYIKLGVVCSPAPPSEDVITSVSLAGRKGARVVPSSWSLDAGSQGDGYQLYTLSLELDSVPVGTYELDTLALTFSDGSQGRWNIGEWTLEFDPLEDKGAQYIRIGKRSGSSSELDWYEAELTNITGEDIKVKGLRLILPGVSTDEAILIDDSDVPNGRELDRSDQPPQSKRYLMDQSLLVMEPGITRVFRFSYIRSDQVSDVQFFAIKPALLLEVNGVEVEASLSSAFYGPWCLDDELVRELIEHGGRLIGE